MRLPCRRAVQKPPEAALPPGQRTGGFCQLVRVVSRRSHSSDCCNHEVRAVYARLIEQDGASAEDEPIYTVKIGSSCCGRPQN